MEADDEALKVRECQESKEAEAQSFQLYHPQVDQGEHREPTSEESSARRRHKELVTEEMLDNEMAILAPGGHAGPAVRGGGQEGQPKAKLRDQYLEGKLTPATG